MKILCWNVNGLRAVVKKDKWNQLFEIDPDIICLQETKSHPDQLTEEVRTPKGYISYFDHSKMRKGYSGVAIFVKEKLNSFVSKVEYGFGVHNYDQEGRFLAVYFNSEAPGLKNTVLITCYFPNGGGGPVRLKYKMEFYDEFLKYTEKLRKTGKSVVFCGDVNTAHQEIDLARPKENAERTGFLPMEREWLDKVVAKGYIDTFRHLNPTKVQYSWWDMKTFARERNVGWRIDYFFISPDLLPHLKKVEIMENVFGSDHCPVMLELK